MSLTPVTAKPPRTRFVFDAADSPTADLELVFDACTTRSMSRRVRVTEYPIESGAVITDHIVREPIRLSVEGVVSDQPLKLLAPLRSIADDPSGNARSVIDALIERGIVFVLEAPEMRIEDLVLTSVDYPRDATTGRALVVRCEMQQITIVDSEFSDVAPTDDHVAADAAPAAQSGQAVPAQKAARPAPAPVEEQTSVLYDLILGP